MSGRKSITLINGLGKPVHSRYRYKLPASALHRAVRLVMEGRKYVQVWDLARGRDLALVSRESTTEVRIKVIQ